MDINIQHVPSSYDNYQIDWNGKIGKKLMKLTDNSKKLYVVKFKDTDFPMPIISLVPNFMFMDDPITEDVKKFNDLLYIGNYKCEMCHSDGVYKCAGCKTVSYCCPKHQRDDWPEHRNLCSKYRDEMSEIRKMIADKDTDIGAILNVLWYYNILAHKEDEFIRLFDYGFLKIDDIINVTGHHNAIINATNQKCVKIIFYLISKNVNLNVEEKDNGSSPLIITWAYGNEPLVKYLLKNGADPNYVNKAGLSLIHYICVHGDDRILPLLISYGIDLNKVFTTDKELSNPKFMEIIGKKPLQIAKHYKHKKLEKMLSENGATE